MNLSPVIEPGTLAITRERNTFGRRIFRMNEAALQYTDAALVAYLKGARDEDAPFGACVNRDNLGVEIHVYTD